MTQISDSATRNRRASSIDVACEDANNARHLNCVAPSDRRNRQVHRRDTYSDTTFTAFVGENWPVIYNPTFDFRRGRTIPLHLLNCFQNALARTVQVGMRHEQ